MQSDKKAAFVIFKRKDERADRKTDKTTLLHQLVARQIKFVAPKDGAGAPLPDDGEIGLDFNRYHAPILYAKLTPAEMQALKRDRGNISVVREDTSFRLKTEHLGGVERPPAQVTPWGIERVNAPRAWERGRGKGVRIAILDCGIDPDHPDLIDNYDAEANSVNCYDHLNHVLLSHGTHCAGVAAAADNDEGVVGVAPEAELVSVKVGQATGSVGALVSGIDWCIDNEIDVISLSREYHRSEEIEQICDAAYAAGILIVASAGARKDEDPDEEDGELPAPACYPTVVAVSGINRHDKLGKYSLPGPKVELCAPGTAVNSSILRKRYAERSGTSMAAPHVAGAAAVVWSIFPGATNVQIREILAGTARHLGANGRNPSFGYGCVDVAAAAELAHELSQSDQDAEELIAIERRRARIARAAAAPRAAKRKTASKRKTVAKRRKVAKR